MHLKRLSNIAIILLILGMFLFVKPVNAQENIENQVDADFNIDLISATYLKVRVTMDVSKIYLSHSEISYTGAEINTISTTNPAKMGSIQYALKGYLTPQIKQTFKDADITIVNELPSYENNKFYDEYHVNLTSPFFDMNETINADEFINGVLDMDANVSYTFDLHAEEGWNNSYIFDIGSDFGFHTNGQYNEVTDTITWEVRNGQGNQPTKTAELTLRKNNPTTPIQKSENIFLGFELDSRIVQYTSLTANVLIESADVSVYDVIPSFISNIKYIPADGVRLFVNNGFFTWDKVYEKTVKPIEKNITSVLESSSFNQTIHFENQWDNTTTEDCVVPYEVNNMNSDPLLKLKLTDNDVDFKICDISNTAFFGLINSGAYANISEDDVNFGDKLNTIGYDYNVTLFLPENVYLGGENIYKFNESVSVSGEFESNVATSFSKEIKDTIIEIEVESSDLNLLSFITGKTEFTFGLYMQETRNYNVTNITGVFDLPNKIVLSNLNSDAFRLCVKENVFSEREINDFLNNEKNLFENRLKNIIIGLDIIGKGNLRRDVFDDSINLWDGNISNMDADTAVKISSYAHCTHPIDFDLAFLPPTFDIPVQKFNFTGIKNHNVIYRIVFPDGISIKVSDPLDKAVVKTKSDGREYIELSFTESEYNKTTIVSCSISPSPLFIIGILMPCIISFIITIILIVTIILIRRKRRKGKGEVVPVDQEEDTGYETEDYYVPPPPDSK